MPRRLIVNADDYGLSPEVSAGIRRAHLAGLVTSTTVMLNMPTAAEAIEAAQRDCPLLGLGVHLVLTAGRPLLPAAQVTSVLALGQAGLLPRPTELIAGLAALAPGEVEAEWRAQVERFVELAGRRPTHLDSHHHSSFLSPELFGIMLRLARDYGCAIRYPRTRVPVADVLGLPNSSSLVAHVEAFLPAMVAAESSVPRPDYFEPRFFGAQATPATLHTLLAGLAEGTTELMCHPGLADPTLAERSAYSHFRPLELQALTDPAVLAEADRLGIERVHFGALRPAQAP